MSSVKFSTTYSKGLLTDVVVCETDKTEDVSKFIERDYSSYGVVNKRIRIKKNVISPDLHNYLQSKGFSTIYNYYELGVDDYVGNNSNPSVLITTTDNLNLAIDNFEGKFLHYTKEQCLVALQVKQMITALMLECYHRDPSEFNNKGIDPQWYGLGDRYMIAYELGTLSGTPRCLGFRAIEILEGGILKLWISYVKPEFRGRKVYRRLMDEAVKFAKANECTKLIVCTDTTEKNSLNDMLQHMGFTLDKVGYRN